MSDTIRALNKIVGIGAERGERDACTQDAEKLWNLLEVAAAVAGDAIEVHEEAVRGNRPRRERVFRGIVEGIADILSDHRAGKGEQLAAREIQELLEKYNIEIGVQA